MAVVVGDDIAEIARVVLWRGRGSVPGVRGVEVLAGAVKVGSLQSPTWWMCNP